MLIGTAVLLIFAIVGWLFVLSPRMSTAADIDEQTASVDVTNASRQHQLAELAKMKNEVPQAAERVQKLINRMPQEAELPKLFDDIVLAAKRAGISGNQISTITPSVPVPLDAASSTSTGTLSEAKSLAQQANFDVAKLDVTMSVTGTVSQIRAFLSNLETLDRDLLVRETTITSAITGKSDRVATVTATAFVLQSQLPDLVKKVNELLAQLDAESAS